MILKTLNKFVFSTAKEHTVFIAAGGPHLDSFGAKLIKKIKE